MRLLTEEQKHWVEVIGDFCKKEIEPIMLDWDKVVDPSKAIPFEPYAKAFKLGLNSFEIPKEYGGNKVDLATAEVMYEEMGYYDGNFASVMQTTNLALKPILIGGTPEQALDASSIALSNLLGLVCDPVGGLVEVPCQNRNAIGVAAAFSSAQLALAGIKSLVPFDQMAHVMLSVGHALPATLRETAKGGIAQAPAALSACAKCGVCG